MGKVINIENHRFNIIHPDEAHTRWEFSIDPDREEEPYITIKCGAMYGFNGWTVYILQTYVHDTEKMVERSVDLFEQVTRVKTS